MCFINEIDRKDFLFAGEKVALVLRIKTNHCDAKTSRCK